MKLIVKDCGDRSVGINDIYWDVDCPFDDKDDKETLEFFRESIINLYAEFAEGRITADFEMMLND